MGDNNCFLEDGDLYLREVRLEDVNEKYYTWMNDPEVTQFLEIRFFPQSMENIETYVRKTSEKEDEIFFAICLKNDTKHIGNIKLGPINWIHRRAEVSLVIGDKSCWGKGYATKAISLISKYAFNKLNLHKLTAGYYKENIGSIKAFLKVGFKEEGVLKDEYFSNGIYIESVRLGLIKQENVC